MADLPLPLTFRAEIIEPLVEAVRAGESCALVGVGSSGKSNIVRFIRDRADARRHYFGDAASRVLWLLVDCNALEGYDEASLYAAMILSLARAVRARSDLGSLAAALEQRQRQALEGAGRSQAYHSLHDAIEDVRAAGDFQIVFALDDCDQLVREAPPALLRRLRALRDDFKYRLMYLTVTRRELHRLRPHSPEFESFYEIVVMRSFAAGPYNDHDGRVMIERLAARLPTPRTIDPLESHRLIQATGGHPGLVKAAFFATRGGELALESDLVDSLVEDSYVMDECRKIWDSLEEEEQAGLIAAARGGRAADDARLSLMAKGLVQERTDGTHAVFCPVFEVYLLQKAAMPSAGGVAGPGAAPAGAGPTIEIFPGVRLVRVNGREVSSLTRLEFDLLCFLSERRGQACRREDLLERTLAAQAMEPGTMGSIDRALDRAILELRRKIEPPGAARPYIASAPGGGYRLIGEDGT